VALGSLELGLQNPSSFSDQFGRKSKNPKSRVFMPSAMLSGLVPHLTYQIDTQAGYGCEEEEETKILGPGLWPEVAGIGRNWPEKPAAVVARGERRNGAGERREKEGFRKWKP
jgi:hypothetical protein